MKKINWKEVFMAIEVVAEICALVLIVVSCVLMFMKEYSQATWYLLISFMHFWFFDRNHTRDPFIDRINKLLDNANKIDIYVKPEEEIEEEPEEVPEEE
jgi:hypothetical protein